RRRFEARPKSSATRSSRAPLPKRRRTTRSPGAHCADSRREPRRRRSSRAASRWGNPRRGPLATRWRRESSGCVERRSAGCGGANRRRRSRGPAPTTASSVAPRRRGAASARIGPTSAGRRVTGRSASRELRGEVVHPGERTRLPRDEILLREEDREFPRRRLGGVGAVDEVEGVGDAEVAADRPRLRLRAESRAEELAADGDRVLSLEAEGDDRRGGHEAEEPLVEGLPDVRLVEPPRVALGEAEESHPDDLESL